MTMKPKYLNNETRPVLFLRVLFWIVVAALVVVAGLILSLLLHEDEIPSLDSSAVTQPFVTVSVPTETVGQPPTQIAAHQTEAVVPVAETTALLTETISVPTETTVPAETTPPQMLESMAVLYEQNPDIVGWLKIEGTQIDYPVMYTPDDPEKYLHLSFEERYSFGGLPFVDASCSMNPESDNLMIYGHNMNNGTMFRALIGYDMKTYWQAHPVISFTTLYEEREYEVLAAFYDRVYYETEDHFRFYRFIDPETEEEFNEGIAYFKDHSLYETDVTAEYGDELITLATCAYHVANGRFVVVAKRSA